MTTRLAKPKVLLSLFAAVAVSLGWAETNTFTGNGGTTDWDTPANWSLKRVPTAEDAVVVAKTVVQSGTTALKAGSLTLNQGAALTVGAANANDRWPEITVTGDLTLNGNATLTIYPGPTNETHTIKTGGARVTVGGTTTLNGTAKITPWTHETGASSLTTPGRGTGAAVVFDLQGFVLGEGASVNSTSCGFTLYSITPVPYSAYSLGNGDYFGGSHGGEGGTVNDNFGKLKNRLPAYDSLLAPVLPGAGGGNGVNYKGGGVIRISATSAQIDGTLVSSGTAAGWSGAGAGGSIWVTADNLSVGSKASFKARGGNVGAADNDKVSGAGAGGRISICVGLTATQIDDLYATGSAVGLSTNALAAVYPGQVNVEPGTIRVKGEKPATWAGAGTAVYVVNVGTKHGFAVENDVNVSTTQTPALGISAYATDELVSASVTSPALVLGSTTVRRVCTGWEIRDTATGEILESGKTASVTDYAMPEADVTLIWKWETVENQLTVGTLGSGTVSLANEWAVSSGDFASVTATPSSADYEFQYWTGDVEPEKRTANPLVLTADRPRSVKAFFGKKTGATYSMNQSNNTTAYDWHTAANWTPNGIPGTNDTAQVLRTGGGYKLVQVDSFARVKSFTVGDTAGANANVRVGCTAVNTSRDMAAHTEISKTASVGFEVLDDLTVAAGGFLAVGGVDQEYPVSLKVGGNLTVAGKLGVTAGSTNHVSSSLYDATGVVDIGGKLTVESAGVIAPNIHLKTGASVVFRAPAIEVAEGGAFDAAGLGYGFYTEDGMYVFPWPTHYDTRQNKAFGGSHGGKGGMRNSAQAPTYGCANAPVYAGMMGDNEGTGKKSGGVIRLEAGTVNLKGALKAIGHTRDGNTYGSGAGGSVYVLVSEAFVASDTAVINVKGGNSTMNNTSAGGGGRAAVGVRLTDEQKAALLESDDVENVKRSALSDVVPGFTAAGGSLGSYTGAAAGEDGTGVYLLNMAGDAALIVVGEPANMGDVTPPYGQTTHAAGKKVDFSAPPSVEVSGSDGNSRRLCGGYVVSNETAGVIVSGPGTSGSFDMPGEDTYLYWDWSRLEHKVGVSVQGSGTIVTNAIGSADADWQADGAALKLTAVPDAGSVFVGWLGVSHGEGRTTAALDVTVDGPLAITAVFASAEGETKTWVGGADGYWTNPKAWSPAGMPGPNDTVAFSGSDTRKIRVNAGFAVPVGSMSVPASVWFICGDGKEQADDTVGFRVTGNLVHNGRMQIGRNGYAATPVLEVGGNLTLNGNSDWNFIALMAAPRENPESADMYRLGGGRLTVGGTLRVGPKCQLHTVCEKMSGAPVVITADEFVVEAGAIVASSGDTSVNYQLIDGKGDQFHSGFGYTVDGNVRTGFAPGSPTSQLGNYHGASYGGLGCRDLVAGGSTLCTTTYGTDFAPYMPGSAGGNAGPGPGGALRIDCRKATIAGAVRADGTTGGANGGSSGGAIWLSCRKLDIAETAVFSAHGGAPCSWGAQGNVARSGGGGGGRIAITLKATVDEIASLYAAETLPTRFEKFDLTDATVRTKFGILGSFNVKGGHADAYPVNDGQPGTAVLVKPLHGLMLIVR